MKHITFTHRQPTKTKRLITLLLALLPIAMQAQAPEGTTFVCNTSVANLILVKDNESGLEYLYDTGDAANGLFIDVSKDPLCTFVKGESTINSNWHFMSDGGLRSNWRTNIMKPANDKNARWYKSALDQITEVDKSNNGIGSLKGVEYFRNLTTLTLPAQNSVTNIDVSKNTKLTSLTFTNSPEVVTLNISNTLLSSLPIKSGRESSLVNLYAQNCENLSTALNLSNYSKLDVLKLSNSPVTSLTLPAQAMLRDLHLDGTQIPTLDVSACRNLRELILSNNQHFTSAISLPTVKTSLLELDLRGTNLHNFYTHSNPLDLRDYIELVGKKDNKLYFDDVDVLGYGFKRYLAADLAIENPDGNIRFHNSNAEEFTYDPRETVELVDFSSSNYGPHMPNLKVLHVIGDVRNVILPEDRTTFTITCENSPNINVQFGTQSLLTTLFVEDVPSIDVSGCTALQNLIYIGAESKNLTLSAANGALTSLDLRESGVEELDLSGGEAPNLTSVSTSLSAMKRLNLSGHTKLSDLALHPSEGIRPDTMSSMEWSKKYVLEELDVSGCTQLANNGEWIPTFRDDWKYFCNIRKLKAKGCRFNTFKLWNSLLTELDLSGNPNLDQIEINQGLLTGNGDIDISGCPNLRIFNAHRHHWENLDFLLVPTEAGGPQRTQAEIDKLEVLQVNGGTYTIKNELTIGGEIELTARADSLIYTTRLRQLNLNYVKKDTFRKLLCEDNLLTELDLTHIGSSLGYLMCARNMLTAIDLSTLPTIPSNNNVPGTGEIFIGSSWSPQVGYVSAEIVRAQGNGEETRKKDWIALHLTNGGYTHKLDNTAKLYPNLYAARNNGTAIAGEQPWMCIVSDANDASITGNTFAGCNFDASAHDGLHIFAHSLGELISENGNKWNDHELDGKVVLYKFNTGYNQDVDENHVPILNADGSMKKKNSTNNLDPHIKVRTHLWPHMININPASKSGTGVDYYSSTLYLDYDALIPEGVECYFISGLTKNDVTPEANIGDGLKFKMEPFGKGGTEEGVNHILPAYTPVYIRSTVDPGLYDFQPLWEFDYLGWENLRGTEYHTLHGVESEPGRVIKVEYQEALAAAQTLKADMPNILTGWLGVKNTTTDMEAKDYNVYTQANESVTPRHVLTLTRNKLAGTNAIGFWPYTGTTIAPHRCYITGEDYNKALKAANLDDAGNIGGTFFFDDNTTAITTVNANTNVSTDDSWYTLGGQRLNSRPTHSGVYINKGKKVVIR